MLSFDLFQAGMYKTRGYNSSSKSICEKTNFKIGAVTASADANTLQWVIDAPSET